MAEAFEDFRDALKAGLGVFHLGQQGIEFIGDDFLFGEWGQWKGNIQKLLVSKMDLRRPNFFTFNDKSIF
ncbi:hypothetical protein KUC_1274 [Vreelandella boliviensis LC1]|uniref:Uncharacterized protein n=1 Tax=Vreelandella boliviensis LC1 TaxID=1072583 RepID=A0A7U9C734_9GAMM|nr:hypothetical protein KUC_1274 [Halomonas boliviensis LC1]